MNSVTPSITTKNTIILIIVASLGYFVDIYDLLIFSIVRAKSLKDIGIPEDAIRTDGEYVINLQMIGLLLGGFIWGIIGDKYGRLKVLFGSILLYSLANIASGFVTNIHTYAIVRLIAGIGLAGELGAGITLVSESMPKGKRGYGTMIVAGIGVLGAAAAFFVAEHFNWRNAYFVGGGMGFLLLILRVGVFESGMYQVASDLQVQKGNFFMIFAKKERALRYIYCLCLGLPFWYIVGILITQSPEIGKALGATEPISAGRGIMLAYIGLAIGEVISSVIAQWSKSRRLSVFIFQILSFGAIIFYLNCKGITPQQFSTICFCIGITIGYWVSFVTIASEQFGTNLRATVTTTAPNFVRGSLVPITWLFEFFVHRVGIIQAGYIVIIILTVIGIFSLSQLKESFNKDLNYIEE